MTLRPFQRAAVDPCSVLCSAAAGKVRGRGARPKLDGVDRAYQLAAAAAGSPLIHQRESPRVHGMQALAPLQTIHLWELWLHAYDSICCSLPAAQPHGCLPATGG
jgi:hypothetical protein